MTERSDRSAMLLIALTAVAGVACFLFFKAIMFDNHGGYLVRAEFRDTNGLRKNSDLKIGGVPAGKIVSLDLTGRDTAMVTMALDDNAVPLGASASAQIRPVNLLGEKYVDLDPGDVRRPVGSGSSIPLSRTGTSVELDDILNMLDPDTRARLRIIINEFGTAVAGRGADFNQLLENLPPALDRTRALVDEFGAQPARLAQLLTQGDRVISAMASQRSDLQDLVGSAAHTLKVTASRREQLAATVQRAAPALAQLRSTLADLDVTAQGLQPAARELRAVAGPLRATLERAPEFARAAAPTLSEALRVAPTLTALGRDGAPVVQRLAPVAGRLATFSQRLDPLTKTLDANWRQVLGLIEGWARNISARDGLGHIFRVGITLNKEVITTLLQRYGAPSATSHHRAPAPAVRAPGGTRPGAHEPQTAPKPPAVRLPFKIKLPPLPKIKLPPLPKIKLPPLPVLGDQNGGNRDGGDVTKLLDYLLGQ
jgi:phospholipid/cholesterol/gamma-HCH transport system substrate-binding protein